MALTELHREGGLRCRFLLEHEDRIIRQGFTHEIKSARLKNEVLDVMIRRIGVPINQVLVFHGFSPWPVLAACVSARNGCALFVPS